MRFENLTPLSARLFRGEPRPAEMLATVVVKTLHDVGTDGELSSPRADASPPSAKEVETPLGIIPGDRVPYRRGIDVWVLGHARPPRPTAAMTVDLAVGDERRVLLVVGDRTWRQDGSVTPPEPFEQMPLVYARAYGGTVVADDEECVHPTNPGGRGFVASTKHLGGTRLPNLEWPDDRLQSWADRPEVAGFSALSASSPLQLSRSVRVDAAAALGFRVTRSLYSCAHPRLVFCDAPVGTPLRLDGVGAGPIHFRVPAGVAAVDVGLGKRRHVLVPRLDTIGILADERRVALTWRASFRYVLVRHELRTTSVRLTNAEASR